MFDWWFQLVTSVQLDWTEVTMSEWMSHFKTSARTFYDFTPSTRNVQVTMVFVDSV